MTIPGYEPRYWIHETNVVLRSAIEAYFTHDDMTPEDIAAMRAYLRQWIMAEVWDENPHLKDESRAWLAELRATIDTLTTRKAIAEWVSRAGEGGLDPL